MPQTLITFVKYFAQKSTIIFNHVNSFIQSGISFRSTQVQYLERAEKLKTYLNGKKKKPVKAGESSSESKKGGADKVQTYVLKSYKMIGFLETKLCFLEWGLLQT